MIWTLFWLLVLAAVGFGNHFTKVALFPEAWTHEDARERELKDQPLELEYYEALEKKPFEVTSQHGYPLRGILIETPGSTRTMIFVHGITYNLYGGVKYLKMFHEWGYNIVLYDQPNHGKSGGDVTTFGYYEKLDLAQIVDYVVVKLGSHQEIGLHGESMGAATALQHGILDSRIAFIISDCSFDTAFNEFKYRLKVEKHLPAFPVLYIASFFSYLKTGVFFSAMNPLKAVSKLKLPVLWIHGLADAYTPCAQTKTLYDAHPGFKHLYLVEGATHAKAYQIDPQKYREVVASFIEALEEKKKGGI